MKQRKSTAVWLWFWIWMIPACQPEIPGTIVAVQRSRAVATRPAEISPPTTHRARTAETVPTQSTVLSSIRYLGFVPADAQIIGYFDLQDVVALLRQTVPQRLLRKLGMSSVDDLLRSVRSRTGLDLHRISHVIIVGRLDSGRTALVLLTSATGFERGRFSRIARHRGVPIYKIPSGPKVAISGKVAAISDRQSDLRWVIDCMAGSSPSIRANIAALRLMETMSRSLNYRKAQLYMLLSTAEAPWVGRFKLGHAGLSADLGRGFNGFVEADPTTAERVHLVIRQLFAKMREDWARSHREMLKETKVLKELGLSPSDLERFGRFLDAFAMTRAGHRFFGEVTFAPDDLKTYVLVAGATMYLALTGLSE